MTFCEIKLLISILSSGCMIFVFIHSNKLSYNGAFGVLLLTCRKRWRDVIHACVIYYHHCAMFVLQSSLNAMLSLLNISNTAIKRGCDLYIKFFFQLKYLKATACFPRCPEGTDVPPIQSSFALCETEI